MDRLATIKQQIIDYATKYDRNPADITLLAASKNQPIDVIKNIFEAGQKIFGESYLQEALPKIAALPPEIEWHFIGHVQRNKTKQISAHFAWVHGVDSEIIAKRLNDQRPSHLPPLNICIEVNLDHEKSKSGVNNFEELIKLAAYCQTLPNLNCRGLMAIPAPQTSHMAQRFIFRILSEYSKNLAEQKIFFDTLSMGMSDDFEAAIAEKSTLVRIGTALFGPRL